MIRGCTLLLTVSIPVALAAAPADAQDWMFDQSTYSNDPKTGKRVDQYKAKPKVLRISAEEAYSIDGPHPFGPFAWESAPWALLEGPMPYAGGYGYYGGFGAYGTQPFYGGYGFGGYGYGGWGGMYPY